MSSFPLIGYAGCIPPKYFVISGVLGSLRVDPSTALRLNPRQCVRLSFPQTCSAKVSWTRWLSATKADALSFLRALVKALGTGTWSSWLKAPTKKRSSSSWMAKRSCVRINQQRAWNGSLRSLVKYFGSTRWVEMKSLSKLCKFSSKHSL